ncbi:putative fatty acyl-CoA reductase CG8303 isoform X2 [Condylostylus longicornis]|nr:putative fatty acyl-CoA reductase CG8303 isoform X2 [Condylostylus longicornis]
MAIITEKEVAENQSNQISVSQFFAKKNMFITGGTGFLGTVLIEALLSAHEDVGIIYVLVRGKRGFDPQERINRMLSKPIFDHHNKKTLAKVVPIVGELSEPNFGFKDELLTELLSKVNIIFHSAATIRFSSPLRTSIKTNLTGTLRTIEFAKRLKTLSAYIYLSTAFCNSNTRGLKDECVYKSFWDPYEMIKMGEDDKVWENFSSEKLRGILRDHPNTYTFTKNLAENLMISEMPGLPAAIVRPSIVYGTWKHPIRGWVGNANSGHLGFLAGFVKGVFRTMSGIPSAPVDIIPCDYVINSVMTMAWYVGTRKLKKPEVVHCTSGEVNPLNLQQFAEILNESVERHPTDYFVWKPHTELRTGWRYALFFYLFQILPSLLYYIPEKLFNCGMTHHTVLEYMQVFDKGSKHFDYFLNKDFRYSLKNALRIMATMNENDQKRYTFDCSHFDWSEFMDGCLIGVRQFYFKESKDTTEWHKLYWKFFETVYYAGIGILLIVFIGISYFFFGLQNGTLVAVSFWVFLLWL